MTLDEIFALLSDPSFLANPLVDIQGTDINGPFTLVFADGTSLENVTLDELQEEATALRAELPAQTQPDAQAAAEFDNVDDAKAFLESQGYQVGNQAVRKDQRVVTFPDGGTEKFTDRELVQFANDPEGYFAKPIQRTKGGVIEEWQVGEDGKGAWIPVAEAPDEEGTFKGFASREEAEQRAQEIGGKTFYDSKTNTFRVQETEEQPQAGQVQIGGQQFLRQPSGQVSPFPQPTQRTFDDFWSPMLDDLFDTGDIRAFAHLWDQRQAAEAGQLDPITLFNLVAPQAANPQHFVELWNGFADAYDTWRQGILGGQIKETIPNQAQGLANQPGFDAWKQQRDQAKALGITQQQAASLGPDALAEALAMKDLGIEEFVRQKNAGTLGQQAATTAKTTFAPDMAKQSTTFLSPAMQALKEERAKEGVLSPDVVAGIKAGTFVPPPLPGETAPQPTTQPTPTMPKTTFQQTPRIEEEIEPIFAGAPSAGGGFSPIPKDPFAAAFTRSFNQQRQERFKRRPPPRVTFR